jgi:hypothetical protein
MERENLVNNSGVCDETGHSPNHRARLVLGQNLSTSRMYSLAPPETVLSHARHHYCKHPTPKYFGS